MLEVSDVRVSGHFCFPCQKGGGDQEFVVTVPAIAQGLGCQILGGWNTVFFGARRGQGSGIRGDSS